ncbi:MAG: PEP-CTERM system histidine kinase PrsK, partial [Gammaproteobacteria bacterium]|nr:PEP-CTERM system histidine kinase PrsK [Gammaproteobacteria bacterium]
MIIGIISYSIAAIFFLILLGVLLTDKRQDKPSRNSLIIAVTSTVFWGFSAVFQSSNDTVVLSYYFLEVVRNSAWIFFLLLTLSHAVSTDKTANLIRYSKIGVYVVAGLMFSVLLDQFYFQVLQPVLNDFNLAYAGYLAQSVLVLVLLEQLLRNSSEESKWAIKFFCLGVGGIFAYDFYLYSDAMLFQRIDLTLWQSRGLINALMVPVIGIAISRHIEWSSGIFISRHVVFHTTTLLGGGIYLLVMGLGGYYVRNHGGGWGVVGQTLFMFGAIAILALLLFSETLRSKLRVFINKHFFHYKYDYRDEWLRFIYVLSSFDESIPLQTRTIMAIAQIMESPGGMLWMKRDGNKFIPVARWNMPAVYNSEPNDTDFIKFMQEQDWVINLDEVERNPGMYKSRGVFSIPTWLRLMPNAWLAMPLLLNEQILGFVILSHAPSRRQNFNWEDIDLLKIACRQATSYLALQEAAQALSEARRFDDFNRLSTYIVHDLKNMIAQLTLIVSNAAKHKHNP